MAYSRAPRGKLFSGSQTGPNVAPNTYYVSYSCECGTKASHWAPFLVSAARKTAPKPESPGPGHYNPKIDRRIIGGASVLYTAPRFPPPRQLYYGPDLPKEEKKKKRLKGYMYHCCVPLTLFTYPPSIPNQWHIGYKIQEDQNLVECCYLDPDRTLGPAYYEINRGTFCNCYKGSVWSKYSGRKSKPLNDNPGVGTYDIQAKPNELQEYLDKVRHERRKHTNVLRFMDQVRCNAMKDDYPSPAEYTIQQPKCKKTKRKAVPKKIERPRKVVTLWKGTPAPNRYNISPMALGCLSKPSCRKGYSAFLTSAPRFQKTTREKKPSPNEYKLPSFVDEFAKKICPHAVRRTAFNTSVPKKLYFLPPYDPVERVYKPCPGSEPPPPPRPENKRIVSNRFKSEKLPYEASCASYNIQKAFAYIKDQKSFRKCQKYNFVFCEKRFGKLNNFKVVEDNSYIPGFKYNLLKYHPGRKNNSGKFGKAKRFFKRKGGETPGPSEYYVKIRPARQTFNVTLGGSTPHTPFQKYRMKLRRSVKPKIKHQQQQQKKKKPEKKY